MKRKPTIFLSLLISIIAVLFLFPGVGFAVEYSITEVKIDAYLLENGRVEVNESHTYSFDGDFNGITREIVPKEGTSISAFQAMENGEALKVEKEDDVYKVFRKGKDESITVDLQYTIEKGVDVYKDIAQFYWPFFDDRNESNYESMRITVHPPKETINVIAFGYDEAFETEEILDDGSVRFHLGEVPSYENGDIRVAYDAVLFPAASIVADQTMREELLAARQEPYDRAAERAQMKERLSVIALFIIPFFSIIILIVILRVIMKERMKKHDVERKMPQSFFIPKEGLSIPATIYFTKGQLPPEAMAASLMDLVRKGFLTQINDSTFKRVNSSFNMLKHEKRLIQFLFEEIGSNGEFSFKDLQSYTKDKRNHQKYQSHVIKWQQAVREEVQGKEVYEKIGKLRLTLTIAGILLLPFLFIFPLNGLMGLFLITLLLVFTYFIFVVAYRPKTLEGLKVIHEWKLLRERIGSVSMKEWKELSNDEKMRAYLYGLGTKDKNITRKNEELIRAFSDTMNIDHNNRDVLNSSGVNVGSLLMIGPIATSNFHTAHTSTESTTESSSSSNSYGGGVGGGGGGSGAF